MKTRNGFVANSSSVSFCIYGVCIDKGAMKKYFPNSEDIYEDLEEILKPFKTIDFWNPEYYDCYYIGRSYDTIKEDETGKEFKNSTEKDIKKALNLPETDTSLSFASFEESWIDG
jgi:hypothetical protein